MPYDCRRKWQMVIREAYTGRLNTYHFYGFVPLGSIHGLHCQSVIVFCIDSKLLIPGLIRGGVQGEVKGPKGLPLGGRGRERGCLGTEGG